MKIEEYIAQSKKELDDMLTMWKEKAKDEPERWPLEMPEAEWGEQELAHRFDMT